LEDSFLHGCQYILLIHRVRSGLINRGGDTTKKVRGLKWGLFPMFKKKRLNSIILVFSMWGG
jgi:hypothetical protein